MSLLVERFVPTKVIRVHNKDKPSFNDDCRRLMIALEFTVVHPGVCRVWLESSDLSLPPLIGGGGCLVRESVGKAEMLSAHFDGKQSRDPIDLPSISQSHYL